MASTPRTHHLATFLCKPTTCLRRSCGYSPRLVFRVLCPYGFGRSTRTKGHTRSKRHLSIFAQTLSTIRFASHLPSRWLIAFIRMTGGFFFGKPKGPLASMHQRACQFIVPACSPMHACARYDCRCRRTSFQYFRTTCMGSACLLRHVVAIARRLAFGDETGSLGLYGHVAPARRAPVPITHRPDGSLVTLIKR